MVGYLLVAFSVWFSDTYHRSCLELWAGFHSFFLYFPTLFRFFLYLFVIRLRTVMHSSITTVMGGHRCFGGLFRLVGEKMGYSCMYWTEN
ncbi:hypothetical protein K440DRAFT_204560 [Wilcoxina mikolae CBS 423.85]|nr:hypothetical protein K440DRAFT_204560 [Wilcoxina mikolae CBS 423.85]